MVTVYYTWIPDKLVRAREDRWLQALPPGKHEAIRRMRFEKGRAASLLGLQLVKRGIRASGFTDFDLDALSFPRGGKPYGNLPIDFNISHSGDMVVCALATDSKIGVDIERLREIRIEAFQRFLNARERAWVGENTRRFFELWTQKEAVVKASGEGGMANLKRVTIEQGEGAIESQSWMLRELNIHRDYVAHVATDTNEPAAHVNIQYVAIVE